MPENSDEQQKPQVDDAWWSKTKSYLTGLAAGGGSAVVGGATLSKVASIGTVATVSIAVPVGIAVGGAVLLITNRLLEDHDYVRKHKELQEWLDKNKDACVAAERLHNELLWFEAKKKTCFQQWPGHGGAIDAMRTNYIFPMLKKKYSECNAKIMAIRGDINIEKCLEVRNEDRSCKVLQDHLEKNRCTL